MELVIVTGISGAGKSLALRHFEDAGYFCVDNLPFEMMSSFIRLCQTASSRVENAAVVIDSRESIFKSDSARLLDELDGSGVTLRILFLDCRNDVLERRYNETRRRHPLGDDVSSGIRAERALLQGLRNRADVIVDSSDLRPAELNARLDAAFSLKGNGSFQLVIESFGYKRGVPFDADMIFDMRFTANPFYEPELRELSGRDAAVRDFIRRDGAYTRFIDDVAGMLSRLIPHFLEQDKRRLLVAFGCTGGRHRSVCAAEEVYSRLRDGHMCKLVHRDLGSEAKEIAERFGVEEKVER